MPDHIDYSRSVVAFRPSVYSTGIQPIQSYTRAWPQGAEYGDMVSTAIDYWSDKGLEGGLTEFASELVGAVSPDTQDALIRVAEKKEAEEKEEARKKMMIVAGITAVSVVAASAGLLVYLKKGK